MFEIKELIETGIEEGKDPKHLLKILSESIDSGASHVATYESVYDEVFGHHLCDKYCMKLVDLIGKKWTVDQTNDVARKINVTFASDEDDYTQYEFNAAMHIVYHMYNDVLSESGMTDPTLFGKMADAYLDGKISNKGELVNFFFNIEKNK